MEKMTHEEYVAAREKVRETYGESSRASAARRDQELARLYVKSGWGQRELAAVEKLSQTHLEHKMRFGKFLEVISIEINTSTLAEGRFRAYWYHTNKSADERSRFQEVITMLEHDATLPKAPRADSRLAQKLKATYGDGKWHGLRPMADKLVVPVEKLQTVLDGMMRHSTHKTFCERRKSGKNDGGWQYRLLPHNGQVIAYDVLKHEFAPLIADIKAESQKNLATAVLGHVGRLAHQLEQLLEKLAR